MTGLIDASRGTIGDPADDVATRAIHYLVHALDVVVGWSGLGPLWHRFWRTYREARPDPSLTHIIPRNTPQLSAVARGVLLGLVEGALEAGHLEPAWADDLFA